MAPKVLSGTPDAIRTRDLGIRKFDSQQRKSNKINVRLNVRRSIAAVFPSQGPERTLEC